MHYRFNQNEPSLLSWSLLLVLTVPLLPTWVLINHAFSFLTAFLAAYGLFSATLFTSIVVYRLSSFHPLAKYPGPTICKISQLWAVRVNSCGKGQHYRKLLHDKYGPIVRIGTPLYACHSGSLLITVKGQMNYLLPTKTCSHTFSARKECQRDLVRSINMSILPASGLSPI